MDGLILMGESLCRVDPRSLVASDGPGCAGFGPSLGGTPAEVELLHQSAGRSDRLGCQASGCCSNS